MTWTELSDSAILVRIGERVKQQRIQMGLQQKELAEKSCVSLNTIMKLEHGKSISGILFISILRTLGMLENLEFLVPEESISPIQMKKLQSKKVRRIRKPRTSN